MAFKVLFYAEMGSIYNKRRIQNESTEKTKYILSKKWQPKLNLAHIIRIRNIAKALLSVLEFPDEAEVCVLEPAIGDAGAVRTVTGRDKIEISIFLE